MQAIEDEKKTCVLAGNGLSQFKVMPFGQYYVSATIEGLMKGLT